MDEIKSGWKTSEFWVAIGGKAAMLAVIALTLTGHAGEQQTATETVTRGFAGIGAVVGMVLYGWSFIRGRTAVKVAALENKP